MEIGKIFKDHLTAVREWDMLLEKKNAYIFGEEEFDLELFQNAMRDSWKLFQYLLDQDELVVSTIHHRNPIGNVSVITFMQLVSQIVLYEADCYVGDESKDYIFNASQYAAHFLLNAVINEAGMYIDEPVVGGDLDGIADRYYEYNIETGDLSDLKELAKQLNKIG